MTYTAKDWRNATTHEGGGDTSTPISAAALEDLETRLSDYTDESLIQHGINVRDYGALGDGSNDDTAEIQAALNAATTGSIVYIPKADSGQYYKLSDTLTVPDVRGLRIVGESMQTSELRMTVNNKPIIQTSGTYQRSLSFEELRLSYTTQQTNASHPNSYAIAFSGPTGTQVYSTDCRRLYIEKATVGIGAKQSAGLTLQIWSCTFDEIQFASVSHNLIKTNPNPGTVAGNPPNKISRILHIDEYSAADPTGAAFYLFGRANLSNLDIEDWKGRLVTWGSGSGTCDGLYTERYVIADAETAINCDNGSYEFRDISFVGATTGAATATLFGIDTGYMRVEGTEVGMDSAGGGAVVHHITGAPTNTRIEAAYPRVSTTAPSDALYSFMYPGSANTVAATRVIGGQGGTTAVASVAGAITLPDFGEVFTLTGTNTVTSITASWAERRVTLINTSSASLADGSNLKLSAAGPNTADDSITLVCDGTNWYETGRSAN